MEAGEVVLGIVFFLSIAGAVVLRGPLGRALAERIAGRSLGRSGDANAPEVSQLVLSELDDVKARLADIEERQDFAERVLAQQRERGQVRPGG
ncbi:MAG: hypothetical protein OER21_02740 [Gemmatimonadota bacterium]|nr:hypothetical protein [Gemmatimonadota bacterium]